MNTRVIAPVIAALAVAALAGCGSSDDSAENTAQPVRSTPTVERGAGASAYVGHYQRHESLMDLNADHTGDINEGANAADVEEWAVSWQPAAQGITITYQRKLKQFGKGLGIGLQPGTTMSAQFTRSVNGQQLLSTSSPGKTALVNGWCGSRTAGGAPECGA